MHRKIIPVFSPSIYRTAHSAWPISLLLALCLVGCGGDSSSSGAGVGGSNTVSTVYVNVPGDPPAAAPTPPGTGTLLLNNAALATMPQANSVTLQTTLDGSDTVLRVVTPSTPANPTGTFVGSGRGNKGIVGLSGFNSLKVTDIEGIEFDVSLDPGTTISNVYFNFLIDIDCNTTRDLTGMDLATVRQSRRVIVWNPNTNSTLGINGGNYPLAGGYTRYISTAADSQWGIVGAPNFGLSSHLGPYGPLTALAGYPNACIVDGVVGDNGLPRDNSIAACATGAALPPTASASCAKPFPGALLLVSDSSNFATAKGINVKRIRIRDRTVRFN